MELFNCNQVARMLGVPVPNGSRREAWLKSHGINSIVRGPKHGKGYQWFVTSEQEILDAGKRLEMSRNTPTPTEASGRHSGGTWESSKFVGNEALRREIQAINRKLDHLVELWENPKDKTF